MTLLIKQNEYKALLEKISKTYVNGRNKAYNSVNTHLLESNWEIG